MQRAKVAKYEAGLPPKAPSKLSVKRNKAIVKAVQQYNGEIENGAILTDDEDGDDLSDGSFDFEDEEEENAPRYAIASQNDAILKHPQMKLLNLIAHNSEF